MEVAEFLDRAIAKASDLYERYSLQAYVLLGGLLLAYLLL